MDIQYRNIDCSEMTEEEISATSILFSENYGCWSSAAPNGKGGQPIRFSKKLIRDSFVNKPDRKVVLAYDNDNLVGHVFYTRRKGEKVNTITWILQLVVKKSYRGYGIGSKMIQSIFGLSDSYACGLFTSNPMTIQALEKATMRPVNEKLIRKNIDKLKSVAADFFDNTSWIDSYDNGMVDTQFFTDHSNLLSNIKKAYPNEDFPLPKNLPEGKEWLAFTFGSQKPALCDPNSLDEYLEFSEETLKRAFANMNFSAHAWAKHTAKEIDFIEQFIPVQGKILDLGCGIGRHSLELARRGKFVIGVDFAEKSIEKAECMKQKENLNNVSFCCQDVKSFRIKDKADTVLCLYDVVGSYPNEKDNLKILKNAYSNLKSGGTLILSVMNMHLTKKRCKKHIVKGIENNLDILLKLSGSNTMQKTGDIFDGKRMILDDNTGIVYRKEQFFSPNSLPIEYIIRDRRYTSEGIQKLVRKAGFIPEQIYFVQAGRFNKPLQATSKNAKEILVIAKKDGFIQSAVNRLLPLEKTW